MPFKSGLPLRQVNNFPETFITKLANLNVTTAEEFIALTTTNDKRNLVAHFLEVHLDDLLIAINSAKSSLPEDIVKIMESSIETSQYGTGALKPENLK